MVYAFLGHDPSTTKAADAALRPPGRVPGVFDLMPTIVFEAGFSQSSASLERKIDLWLRGGYPTLTVVILVDFRVRGPGRDRVAGQVRVYKFDSHAQEPVLTASSVRDNL